MPKTEKGGFLVQAMIMVVLLALIGTGLIQIIFGRRILLRKANAADAFRQRAFGIESQVRACLDATDFGYKNCSLAAAPTCIPAAIGGKSVTVTAGGSPPACTLNTRIGD
ncbi:MAG: hypothetical protein A2X36_16350 [Elusimicrobia bacterium GWA2_69_24]|nr:MAG: hypothetical protein A2X36_16350 [Elusimicrobia bacterium GWA2_69_24]